MKSLYLLPVNAWVSALQAIMPGENARPNLAQKYNDLKAVYWQHHARLGAPSLVHDMHDLGYSMSERTVGRMLKKLGLRSRIARKYKHTTDSNHRLPTAPNLFDRQFGVGAIESYFKLLKQAGHDVESCRSNDPSSNFKKTTCCEYGLRTDMANTNAVMMNKLLE